MSFSELLFTFQPFLRPRFRMIVCPIIPFAPPRATRMLTRPIAHTFAQSIARMLATLVFPLSRFRLLNKYARPARLPRTNPARALARRPRLCRLSKRSSHKARGSRSAIPRRWKSISRMPRKEWYND